MAKQSGGVEEQDVRSVRRNKPRWEIGRLFAWLNNFWRLIVGLLSLRPAGEGDR